MTVKNNFKQLLNESKILVLPGIYDCLSAKIAQQIGFEAVFTSGYGISASTLGMPDYGFVTATEMLNSVGHIAAAVDIPVIADLDTGYGNPLNVIRTVSEAVKLGVSGLILEDQEWPKRCGHFNGKRVISAGEQIEKIKAAVYAKGDSDLVIIARTDARAPLGLEEAIARGRAYYQAGADIVFVEAPQSREDLSEIAKSLPNIPLFANMIEGGKTPCLAAEELAKMGFKIVVYPLTGLFSATKAMLTSLTYLKEKGNTQGFTDLVNFNEFANLIEIPKYKELEKRFTIEDK
jgi:methylisocitrate lyase